MSEKTCRKCGLTKPLDLFHHNRASKDGHTAWCAECAKRHQQFYRDNGSQASAPRDCLNCGETFTPPERKPGERGRPPVCCTAECQEARTKALIEAKYAERVYRQTLRRHHITDAQFKALLAWQGGRCKLCGSESPGGQGESWKIDHDHACCPGKGSCGKCIRGLLCNNHNLMLGLAHDDLSVLEAAIEHLKAGPVDLSALLT